MADGAQSFLTGVALGRLLEEEEGSEPKDGKKHGGRPKIQLDLERIRRLRAEGWSLRQIGKECGVSKTTVSDALRNPVRKLSENPQEVISPRERP